MHTYSYPPHTHTHAHPCTQVANAPPVVWAGPDLAATAGAPVTLAAITYADPSPTDQAAISAASVDWGDGTGASTVACNAGACNAAQHTYAAPGVYTATVAVADPGGAVGSDSVTVTVGRPRVLIKGCFF